MDSLNPSPDFGDYCVIEQHRYGAPNEHYLYKVLGRVETNAWKTVPAKLGEPEALHPNIEPCVRVMCCTGSRIDTFNIKDIRPPVGFNVPQWNRRAPGESPAPTPSALDLAYGLAKRLPTSKAANDAVDALLAKHDSGKGGPIQATPEALDLEADIQAVRKGLEIADKAVQRFHAGAAMGQTIPCCPTHAAIGEAEVALAEIARRLRSLPPSEGAEA